MGKTIADVLVALAETETRIVKTVAETKEELVERIGELEVTSAEHEVKIKGHDRELAQVKRDFRDHKKGDDGTGVVSVTPGTPTRRDSSDRIQAAIQSKAGTYASLGAFLTGVVLTVLNFLGVI